MDSDEQTTTTPPGDFKLTLAGREIWFRKLEEAQRTTLSRIERRMQRSIREILAGDADEKAKRHAIAEEIDLLYQRIWDAVDSTMIFPADVIFLEEMMLTGKLAMSDAMRVFNEGRDEPAPADDAPPATKARPARPAKKAVAAKKAVSDRRRG